MKKIHYILDEDLVVEFNCPKCNYNNRSGAYHDELVYRDELEGICAACKTEYILVPKDYKTKD